MILKQDAFRDNIVRGKKITETYSTVRILVETEEDMQALCEEYKQKGWKLGYYNTREKAVAFELKMSHGNYKELLKTPEVNIHQFNILWEALVKIVHECTTGKEMRDVAIEAMQNTMPENKKDNK